MKHMPHNRHVAPQRPQHAFRAASAVCAGWRSRGCPGRHAAAVCAADPSQQPRLTPHRASGSPSLKATLAEANKLSAADRHPQPAVRRPQDPAQAGAGPNVIIAKEDAARDLRVLARDQAAVGAIAVEGYMTEGMNPSMQLLESSSPQSLLNRASIMTQLEQENGAKLKPCRGRRDRRRARAGSGGRRSSSGQRRWRRNGHARSP